MVELFQSYLEQPTAERYGDVRAAVQAHPEYDPYATDLDQLAQLCEAGELDEARRLAESMMPAWALSPRVHFLAAMAAQMQCDLDDAQIEQFTARTVLQSLLETGEGTAESPYQITYLSDELDILDALRLSRGPQHLLAHGSGRLDVVSCPEGREVWFDVGDLLNHAARRRPMLAGPFA